MHFGLIASINPMESLISLVYQVVYLLNGLINLIYHIEYLGYYLKRLIPRKRRPIGFQIPKTQRRHIPRAKPKYKPDPKITQLQRELVSLLGGDVVTAKRLIRQTQQKYPEKSNDWCLQKVVFDLKLNGKVS